MAEEITTPFADVAALRARWPDMPAGADAHAEVLLLDASQYIADTCPEGLTASAATKRRVVCALVKRSMNVPDHLEGMSQVQETTGGVSRGWTPANADGDFYLKKAERQALGCGKQKAFGVPIGCVGTSAHLPWCSVNFGAYCSCGVDIAGEPIFERG